MQSSITQDSNSLAIPLNHSQTRSQVTSQHYPSTLYAPLLELQSSYRSFNQITFLSRFLSIGKTLQEEATQKRPISKLKSQSNLPSSSNQSTSSPSQVLSKLKLSPSIKKITLGDWLQVERQEAPPDLSLQIDDNINSSSPSRPHNSSYQEASQSDTFLKGISPAHPYHPMYKSSFPSLSKHTHQTLSRCLFRSVIEMTSTSAAFFVFDLKAHPIFQPPFPKSDVSMLGMDSSSQSTISRWGPFEAYVCLTGSSSQDDSSYAKLPSSIYKLITLPWVVNHWRWIVWKLASLERAFPYTLGSFSATRRQLIDSDSLASESFLQVECLSSSFNIID